MDVRIALLCLALGAATEALSAALGLWLYHPPWLRVANVVLGFGVLFGWVSSLLGDRLLVLHGPVALVLGVGITWGLLPLVVPRLVAR